MRLGTQIQSGRTGRVYSLGAELGKGAFGTVHECASAGAPCVAKYLRPIGQTVQTAQSEWAKECELMLAVDSPYIIKLYDWFQFDGLFWMILERASHSLRREVAKNGKLAEKDVVLAGSHLMAALEELYAKRIVHRDLQIDNILYSIGPTSRSLKVADFGVAKKLMVATGHATTFIGRPYEIAPELAVNGYTTHQSDLYQVGLAMYFMATGTEALTDADGTPRTAITSGLARRRAESLQTPLGNFISVLLRRRADYRFANARDAQAELRRVLQQYP